MPDSELSSGVPPVEEEETSLGGPEEEIEESSSVDEPTAEVSESPAPDESTPGEEQPEGPAAGAPDPASTETPPVTDYVAPTGDPFGFTADGVQVAIDGAVRNEHGVWIPTDAWGQMQHHLADRGAIQRQWRAYEDQLAALNPETNEQVLQATHMLAKLASLLDEGPAAVADWLDDLESNRPLLEAQAAAAAAEGRATAAEGRYTTAEDQQFQERLPEYLVTATEQSIMNELAEPDMKEHGLEQADLKEFYTRIRGYDAMLFFRADRDYPENGIKAGQVSINLEFLRRELGDFVTSKKGLKAQSVAKAANEADTPPNTPPPAVSTRGPAPAAVPGKAPHDWDTWEEDFDG